MTETLIGFAVLLCLVLARVPLAYSMGIVGFVGFAWLIDFNWNATLSMAARRIVDTGQDYSLSVIPLFILMGNLVNKAGISSELYRASNAFVGHRKGGLSMATILACGGFSAICGSSLATAATMSKVAMPPMRQYGYRDSLASASIAAGGTLGILIPPSVMLVVYGLLTESSIRELFAAGLVPGLLGVALYLLAVRWVVSRDPESAPPLQALSWPERFDALKGVLSTLALFVLVMGGIYAGVFTPTEAAGIGAAGAFVIALLKRQLNMPVLKEVLVETAITSSVLFSVVISALIFSNFINRAGFTDALLMWVTGMELSPLAVMAIIVLVYLLLGCVFESMSMLLLTVPIFFPLVQSLGFDLIWFGILVVVVTEISLITPPVGMNVFVLSGVVKDINTKTIFRGIVPFWVADMVRLALIAFIPAISLALPHWLYA
ncbi:TRAP transporter large permease [Grimontia hollisae]|uniref:TRAP transporter large permease protein n=2 Tax=Grimontia hollisae TaxID=673 RepID=D0I3B2_GRIHO|nr:TRAP transporter large permease [Grimontia hollisae]AMG30840.1 TRAP transporter large permease [Grimontia hollisae]EEY73933.1 TRAP-type C4-dicarboxylate transport system large permease component [Grimontia hollisae CIP 101886]MDF2186439.1 TRAP transporter large permease [Grimontia hollisae]STO47289.1 Neu5Ac permease [Grimontia hollisae]STO56283.1 Neu5Ac permease [Grimontia hollisae]